MQIDTEIKKKENETEAEMVKDRDNEDKGDREASL